MKARPIHRAVPVAPVFGPLDSVSTRQCRGCGCVFAYENGTRTPPLQCGDCYPWSPVRSEVLSPFVPEPCAVCGRPVAWTDHWAVTPRGRAHAACVGKGGVVKLVINACFGGFGLSHAAMLRYGELKGWTVDAEPRHGLVRYTYWRVPPSERVKEIDWGAASTEERAAYNKAHGAQTLWDHDIPRDDPELVRVVEEMGAAANGDYADLRVVEVPDGVAWEIDDYDGNEHVAEAHRTWR